MSLLKNPPQDNKYATLKVHLLKMFELSATEWAGKLFSLQVLGDSEPSDLLDKMPDLLR